MANNIRFNSTTDSYDYFFPMELTSDADREYARFCGFEIGMARLGYRHFLAIFVPCKDRIVDKTGRDIFIETSEERQRARYLEYIKDELREQDAAKQDGRCVIPDGKGKTKRCPCRIPNPGYVPGGDQPKTLPVRCEGCKFEAFRQAHTFIPLSSLDYENESSETESYEVPAPDGYGEGDRYERMEAGFIAYVHDRNPKLEDLARLLLQEYTRSEAARELGMPLSTAGSRREKLMELCREFLDTTLTF